MRGRNISEWNRLDNAAKIFPSNSTKDDTKVFRFACELKEDIDPVFLQTALDATMGDFPIYSSTLKHGLFWYYLEESAMRPYVREENAPPCSPIYHKDKKSLLFRVTYYRKRINLEVYHALSDGTGALQFLRTLVYRYLLLKYPGRWENTPVLDYDATDTQKNDDSFQKYYKSGGRKRRTIKKRKRFACRLRMQRVPEGRMRIIEGVMPLSAVLGKAREMETTVTALLSGILLVAIAGELPARAKKRPVVLDIPVNLRKYFDSASARNFFSVVNVGYDFSRGSGELMSVVRKVREDLRSELAEENIRSRLDALAGLEHNLLTRVMPLFVKDVGLRIAYDVNQAEATAALSNIGKITMPEEMADCVRLFDVIVSTNRLQICMCSYRDNLTVSFSSAFLGTDIQKRFFRILTEMGIEIEITANRLDGWDRGEKP